MTRKQQVDKIIMEMSDEHFDKLNKEYLDYIFGDAPKRRLNYWLKKFGLSLEEFEEWSA